MNMTDTEIRELCGAGDGVAEPLNAGEIRLRPGETPRRAQIRREHIMLLAPDELRDMADDLGRAGATIAEARSQMLAAWYARHPEMRGATPRPAQIRDDEITDQVVGDSIVAAFCK